MTSTTTPRTGALPDRPRGGATTWYEVLDVGPDATTGELRIAYDRSLALVEGRTLGGYFLLDPLAIDSARADIEAAWHVLSDAERRSAYDHAIGLPPSTALPAPAAATPTVPAAGDFPSPPPQTTPPRIPRTPSLKFLAPVLDDTAPAGTTTAPTSTTTTAPTSTAPTSTAQTSTAPTSTAPTSTAPTTTKPTQLPTTVSPLPFHAALFALDGEVNGQVLKKLREARGLSLDELAELTKIRRPYLQAIEEQDLENLPARVYLRGFLTQIARALRVDKTRLAEGYVAFVARFGG